MAKVSVESRSICRLISGSDCRIFSISGLGAEVSETEVSRFATSEALVATSDSGMTAEAGGTATCGGAAGAWPKDSPAAADRKKTAATLMASRPFAIRSALLPICRFGCPVALSRTRLRRPATTVNRPRSKRISQWPPASQRRLPIFANPCADPCGVALCLNADDGAVLAFILQCCSNCNVINNF